MRVTASGASERGPRPTNQDALHVDAALGLFVVADGMGGHNAGDVASKLAIDTVVEFIRASDGTRDITWPFPFDPARSVPVNRVEVAFRLANRKVRDAAARNPGQSGMGTTIVAVLVDDGRVVVGHVGDSRAYVLRGTELRQMTVDHTWLNAMGGEATPDTHHPMRHVLTNGIGIGADLSATLIEVPLTAGERWLMCTDGVHGALDREVLQRVLRANASAEHAARDLVQHALRAGTTDNATAVVLNVDEDGRV